MVTTNNLLFITYNLYKYEITCPKLDQVNGQSADKRVTGLQTVEKFLTFKSLGKFNDCLKISVKIKM